MTPEMLEEVQQAIDDWASGAANGGDRPTGSQRYEQLGETERRQYRADVLLSIAVVLNYAADEDLYEKAEEDLKAQGQIEPSDEDIEVEAFKLARSQLELRSATNTGAPSRPSLPSYWTISSPACPSRSGCHAPVAPDRAGFAGAAERIASHVCEQVQVEQVAVRCLWTVQTCERTENGSAQRSELDSSLSSSLRLPGVEGDASNNASKSATVDPPVIRGMSHAARRDNWGKRADDAEEMLKGRTNLVELRDDVLQAMNT